MKQFGFLPQPEPITVRGKGVDFTWSELMFRPELCLNKLFLSV